MKPLVEAMSTPLLGTLTAASGDSTIPFQRITNTTFDTNVTGWTGVTWGVFGVAVLTNPDVMVFSMPKPLRGGETFSLEFTVSDFDFDPDPVADEITIALYNDGVLSQVLAVTDSASAFATASVTGKVLDDADSIRVSLSSDFVYINVDEISLVA